MSIGSGSLGGLVALLCAVLATPALAGLTARTLSEVEVAPPPNARVPLSAIVSDDNGVRRPLADVLAGHPAVLIFADYTCQSLCGPILSIAAAGLATTGLRPGKDFVLVVIGLDPKDSADEARAMKRAQIGDGALAATSAFLRADEGTVRQIADAVGYRYAYDAETDQFAHPAAVFVLAPVGRVARMLSALGLSATDLRLALVEAGQGRIGGLADHLRLLCYGYDPATGVYTLMIGRWLAFASALTAILLAGGIGFMLISRRPAAPAYRSPSAPSGQA